MQLPDPARVDSRLVEFKGDLLALDARRIVQKHVTFGEAEVLSRSRHFDLRSRIADRFSCHPHTVVVVGSAKLGFSIKPSRRYGLFGDRSDIDLAIVSSDLFMRFWRDVLAFVDAGGYWEDSRRFRDKMFDGWMRPDLLPPSARYGPASEWWEFFRGLTNSGDYGPFKISAGLYLDWDYLERYQVRAVVGCQEEARN